MTFALSIGKYGGFYFRHEYTTRLCLGWVALTFYPFDMDDLHDRHLDAIKTMAGMMDDQSRELARLRIELDEALNALPFDDVRAALATMERDDAPPTITPLWDETRCRVCGWPVKERIEDGCTRESCSQRPLPTPRADAGYAPAAAPPALEGAAG